MADVPRPVYVALGTCDNKCMDKRLYKVPGTPHAYSLLCVSCLKELGYVVPKTRTADDIEVVDGELYWKKDT
jgi:hypothetical protein